MHSIKICVQVRQALPNTGTIHPFHTSITIQFNILSLVRVMYKYVKQAVFGYLKSLFFISVTVQEVVRFLTIFIAKASFYQLSLGTCPHNPK